MDRLIFAAGHPARFQVINQHVFHLLAELAALHKTVQDRGERVQLGNFLIDLGDEI